MKNLTLENDYLSVNINTKGAELSSLLDKRNGVEHMWMADPKFWPRQAPLLFPCVGESKDGIINIEGVDYPMGRHGFVRHEVFTVVEESAVNVILELRSKASTRVHFPFEFAFRVGFELKETKLIQSFEVVNTDKRNIGFQLGGHPAFSVPFRQEEQFSDYHIQFDTPMTIDRHLLSSNGLYNLETRRVLTDDDKIDLFYELFNEDALVFKEILSKKVWIQAKKGGKRLQVDYQGFPHLGIWSIPGANYVCIEPWIGCADDVNQSKDFWLKDSLVSLRPGENFKADFSVSLIES